MSPLQKPMWHPPMPVTGPAPGDPKMRYLQEELATGKLIGTGQDGAPETHPYCAILGLEAKRNTPDLLLTGFPLEIGLELLEGISGASERVDYVGKNVVILLTGRPAIALLGERDLAQLVPDVGAFYLQRHFRLVQCVLADPSGLFPWDPGFGDPHRQYYWGHSRLASWDDVPLNGIR